MKQVDRAASGIQTPSGTAQRTKPPPPDTSLDSFLFADLDGMRLRWATGGETREKLLRSLGGLVFSLVLVGTLHLLIALTE